MLHTVATWFHRNNTITCHWVGSGQTTKHHDDSFHGSNRLKSCVCTRCFQFDICRVGFRSIWGYVDGLLQQRRNSGAFSNGEHYVFLALTHRNIHHGTRSRVYHTLTTVDDLVPQGANASADILNTTFSLIFFSASVLAVLGLHCSWLLIIFSSCTCSVFSKTWRKNMTTKK